MWALLLALIVGLLAACGSVTATAQNTATAATATSVPTATSGATATASASTNATVAAASCASPATALTELTEGPYYKANPPQRSTITATGVAGTPFVLTGFVLTKSCAPLANALINLSSASATPRTGTFNFIVNLG